MSKTEYKEYYVSVQYEEAIDFGKQYFKGGYMERAKASFLEAIRIFPNGKEANFGLTRSLLLECKLKGIDCELAESYYESTKMLKNITEKEIKILDELASL